MSTAAKNKPSATSKSNGNWLPKAIGTLVTLIGLTLFVFLFGSVNGEEFNPWTFRRQSYKFVQIPLLRLQVMPTKYKSKTCPAGISIAPILGVTPDPAFEEEDFDKVASQKKPKIVVANTTPVNPAGRWDIVSSYRIASMPWFGEAKILCDLLDVRDHKGAVIWDQWTLDHPKAANVLWPIIARTAQANLYILIPDLLDIASDETDARKLQPKLEAVVAREAETMGGVFAKNDDHARALQSFQLALDYAADTTVANKGVAAAKQAIADLQAAEAKSQSGNSTATTNDPPPAEIDAEFNDDTL